MKNKTLHAPLSFSDFNGLTAYMKKDYEEGMNEMLQTLSNTNKYKLKINAKKTNNIASKLKGNDEQ